MERGDRPLTIFITADIVSGNQWQSFIRGICKPFLMFEKIASQACNNKTCHLHATTNFLNFLGQVTNTSGPKQSIFHYPENKTFLSFINVGFVPMFTDNITFANATLEALAKEACGDNIQCLFDIASTGSLNVGKLTKSQEDEEEDTRSKMGKRRCYHRFSERKI